MKVKCMKILLMLSFTTPVFSAHSQVISLSSAIANKWVSISLKATGALEGINTNSHVGKCVSYQMRNISGKPLNLNLEAGFMFQPADTTIQPLLFTDNSNWALKAGAVAAGYLNAMCAALHKGSPQKDRAYSLGKLTSGVMKKFAQLVSKKQYQNNDAQEVLWAITDKKDLYGTFQNKSQMNSELLNFVKTEMKIDPSRKGQYFIPKKEIKKTVSVRVSESFITDDSGVFQIKIMDAAGNIKLQQNLQNQKQPGEVNYTFWISNSDLPLGKYKVKYYINNKEAYKSEFELELDE